MKYTKGKPTQLSTNFKSTEFDCHGKGCCSTTEVDPKLVEFLQVIRDRFGKSVHVSSGYRCPVHNKNVGGATGSRHGKGQAADIYIDGVKPKEIAQYAENMGIKGIGLYETSKDGFFVHVDTRTSKSFWYGQAQAKRTTFQDANSAPAPVAPTVQVDTSAADPKKMWDFFKSKGMTQAGIAGVMGNLYAESSLRPCNLQSSFEKKLGMTDAEYTAAVDAGTYTNFVRDGAGYGLAQWTYWSLKQDMLDFHKAKGKSIGDLNTQMEFLVHQLSTEFAAVWKVLTSTTSVREASDAMLLKFERPADQSESVQQKRADYGQKYYDQFAAKKPVFEPEKATQNTQAVQKDELPTLRRGDENEAVRELQTKLTELGFTTKGVDGKFGANTEAALRAFQKERDLVPDGICGAKTWAEIYAFAPYNVLVNVNVLNVRIGPSTGTAIKGQVRKGEKATVVWQLSNWGKLKDGAGWICLDYVKKI